MLFLLTDSPQKLKLENIHTLIILFYVSPRSTQPQMHFFLLKTHKKTSKAAVDLPYLRVEVADQGFSNFWYVIN